MRKTEDPRVQKFLTEVEVQNPVQYEILQNLRQLVFATYPNASERIMYGGIMFSLSGEDFGGIFSYKRHVSFEFGRGSELSDPASLLEGKGKMRRHLKLQSLEDIQQKQVQFYLEQVQH